MLRSAGPARVRTAAIAIASTCLLAALAAPTAVAGKGRGHVPVIFVHGQSGSAQQFETNAMRFAGNGYPRGRLFAYEYDTSDSDNETAVENLVPFIAEVKSTTGAANVDVIAHSRGTTVMHAFLEGPARAALVRRYVNLDGRSSDSRPGGVPTLAVWGEGDPSRAIGGARNVHFANKGHTEVATSRHAFGEIYEFLAGERPTTTAVVPERANRIEVAGRASLFPVNEGIEGGRFDVYQLRRASGARKPGGPVHSEVLGADGAFGPFKVNGRKRYEFAVSREGETTLHNYPEPFERDDYFYRVLTAPPLEPFIESGPDHTVVAVTRMREWWGDGRSRDKLKLDGRNVINPATAPRERRVLAVFNFDRDSDGVTDTSESLFPFNSLSFLTAVDVYLPSDPEADGSIAVKQVMRGKRRNRVVTKVPNWPSATDTVSVYFKDYAAKRAKRARRGGRR